MMASTSTPWRSSSSRRAARRQEPGLLCCTALATAAHGCQAPATGWMAGSGSRLGKVPQGCSTAPGSPGVEGSVKAGTTSGDL